MNTARRPNRPGLLDALDRSHVIDGTPDTTERALRRLRADPRTSGPGPGEPEPQPRGSEPELLVDVREGAAPVAVGPADSDLMIQLTRLAKLHRGGLLSDGEFTAAKARLLGG